MLDSLLIFKNRGEDGAVPLTAGNINFNFNLIKELLNVFHPIGEYFETSDVNFDPNVSWGGTWVLDNDGTVLVSKSNNDGSKFNNLVGKIIGEENHILTADELAEHAHDEYIDSNGVKVPYSLATGGGESINGAFTNLTVSSYAGPAVLTGKVGENKAHNNIQPSKIIYRWHRTA